MGRVNSYELSEQGLDAAAGAVKSGQLVVLPTDTVYGIGADPFTDETVQALLDAKQRGQDMPPPVLIAERSMLRALVSSVPDGAKALAASFWPGPLTLILDQQKASRFRLGLTRGTVAVRVPDHDGARALLRRTGPLAVSSANISGRPAATDCAGAREQLGESVAVYLDSGATPGPVPSTIVDFSTSEDGIVLRLGKLSLDDLRAVVPGVQLSSELRAEESGDAGEPVEDAPQGESDDAPEDTGDAQPAEDSPSDDA